MKSVAVQAITNINNRRKKMASKQQTTKKKRSLGNLRIAPKSKPNSPNAIGDMRIQKETILFLMKQLNDTKGDEIICNLASWSNVGKKGPFLTVELSPRYLTKKAVTNSARTVSLQQEVQ
jgi:hypothetical protein